MDNMVCEWQNKWGHLLGKRHEEWQVCDTGYNECVGV